MSRDRQTQLGWALCLTLIGACAPPWPEVPPAKEPPIAAGMHDRRMYFDGLWRTYSLYVPSSVEWDEPLSLVAVLHGGWGTGEQAARNLGFSELAEEKGFLVVYPDGYLQNWSDGRGTSPSEVAGIDDVSFLAAMIAELQRSLPIDAKRVYAAGISNGAIMCHRLACERSDLVAAVAAVAGTFPVALSEACQPSAPVSLVMFHGTLDLTVPFTGGEVNSPGRGEVLSVSETVRHWATTIGLDVEPVAAFEPDNDPEDGTRAQTFLYEAGTGGPSVLLYAILGGGHTWPGGPGEVGSPLGPVCRDIDATFEIWDFFSSHPKP